MNLTPRQQQVLDFLRQQIQTTGLPPSMAELMAAFGWSSPNGAAKHLQALAAKGVIALTPHKARGIRLLEPLETSRTTTADTLALPLVGRVAAGEPVLSMHAIERRLIVDRWLFQPRPDFLLRVQGDSMIEDGILDGDLVAGKATPDAQHGQTVIARVGEGITIKRLHHQDGQIRLLPRNAAYAPIDPAVHEDFAIEGIYCGLLRRA
ncbi:transcriptional repressor LexA [Corticibacter populi]|uniref:LexA repressor n=1 Tax=Corticibacter populi TaxID=1550736 RepID=A0A3M6QYG2_9BURK|nr:transcriptional repressor LexA [Corticibacter populi]RMX07923.1 transcriptional repressor LexA [Corticibacter populi]